MKKLLYFGILTVLISTVSCKSNSDLNLNYLLSVVDNNPDTALTILNNIDRNKLDQENMAIYSLAYTWASDKCGNHINDSLIRIAYNYFRTKRDSEFYARTMYYMGKHYTLSDSTEKAEYCLNEAIESASVKRDIKLECLATERLSRIVKLHDLNKAEQLAVNATRLYILEEEIDTVNLVLYMLNEMSIKSQNNHVESALSIGHKALELSYQTNNLEIISAAHQIMSFAYSYNAQSDSALIHAKEAYYRNNKFGRESTSAAFSLISAYIDADSTSQALNILQILDTKSLSQAYSKYYYMFKASIKKGDINKSIIYVDSARYNIEKICNKELEAKNIYYEKAIRESNFRARAEGVSSMKTKLIIIICVLAIVVIVYILHIGYIKTKTLKYKMRIEKEKNEREIYYKEAQLSILRDFIVKKVDIISRLNEKFKRPNKAVIISEEDWNEIEAFIESSSNAFVSRIRIKFDNLSAEDIRLMMLIRLKLPAKYIATIYNITETSVKHKLFMYKSKVGIDGEKGSLRSFIEEF